MSPLRPLADIRADHAQRAKAPYVYHTMYKLLADIEPFIAEVETLRAELLKVRLTLTASGAYEPAKFFEPQHVGDGCKKCGCLEQGHHGIRVGCEGVGGNCPCDGVFVPQS